MIYYKEVEVEEHLLFAKEVAKEYDIQTENNKIAIAFVSAYLRDHMKEHGEDQLMYKTDRGLTNVYPARVYIPAMHDLIERIVNEEAVDKLITIKAAGKNYKIIKRSR